MCSLMLSRRCAGLHPKSSCKVAASPQLHYKSKQIDSTNV